MGFFGKDKEEAKKTESQRIDRAALPKPEPKPAEQPRPAPLGSQSVKRPPATPVSIKNFIVGLSPSDKLVPTSDEKFEEGLRAALPRGGHVSRLDRHGEDGVRYFEITITGSEDMTEVLGGLTERGILEGEVKLTLSKCTVICKAEGVNAPVQFTSEAVDKETRISIRSSSVDVLVQYPPAEIHKRWLNDSDYREAFTVWRTQRAEDGSKRWHTGWPSAAGAQDAPPWVKLTAARAGEYAIDFDDDVLLRFAFQGADTTIMRFNLRVLLNKVTGETAVYHGLPVSLESIPRDLVDRMNKEPDRFKSLREPGKFVLYYDLVRQLYEEAGGEHFHLETPRSTGTSSTESPAEKRSLGTSRAEPRPASVTAPASASAPSTTATASVAKPGPRLAGPTQSLKRPVPPAGKSATATTEAAGDEPIG